MRIDSVSNSNYKGMWDRVLCAVFLSMAFNYSVDKKWCIPKYHPTVLCNLENGHKGRLQMQVSIPSLCKISFIVNNWTGFHFLNRIIAYSWKRKQWNIWNHHLYVKNDIPLFPRNRTLNYREKFPICSKGIQLLVHPTFQY